MKQKITWYLLGVVTPIFILVILFLIGVNPSPSKEELLISKWQIFEKNENNLLIHVLGRENVCFVIGVERNPKDGLVEGIDVTNGLSGEYCIFRSKIGRNHPNGLSNQIDVNRGQIPHPVFPNFVYRTKGSYGTPMIVCGLPTGVLWRDENADNQWDKRIDHQNKKVEINVNDRWIKTIGKKGQVIITDKDLFKFDVESGKWQIIDPNAFLE